MGQDVVTVEKISSGTSVREYIQSKVTAAGRDVRLCYFSVVVVN